MPSKNLCLLFLAVTLNASVALAQDRIRISIKNDYNASLNFGVLGKGSREGIDTADGVLEFQAGEYCIGTDTADDVPALGAGQYCIGTDAADGVLGFESGVYKGTVTAWVSSTQTLTGLGGVGNCGPGTYRNLQQLQVVGRRASGFNPLVQTVTLNPATSTEYLSLIFLPVPGAELQPPNPNPDQDQVIDCHTIIESEAGRFLPLNDSRWTMEGGGYIIALPSSGTINYTDDTVSAGGAQIGPFKVNKSIWTIQVERLP